MSSTTSDSERLSRTCFCIRLLKVSRGFWEPGVSTKTAWYPSPLRIPRMGPRVVWGRGEVIETLAPTSRLTRVDLPTFGRPSTATKPLLKLLRDFFITKSPDRRRAAATHPTCSVEGCLRLRPQRPLRNRTRAKPGDTHRKGSRAQCWGLRWRRAVSCG